MTYSYIQAILEELGDFEYSIRNRVGLSENYTQILIKVSFLGVGKKIFLYIYNIKVVVVANLIYEV